MLNDRPYMRRGSGRDGGFGSDPAGGLRVLYMLIAINIVAFLLFSQSPFGDTLCLNADQFRQGAFYQPVTAIFMHAGFSHLLFNMISLYVFGSLTAPLLGPKRFLGLFLGTGIFGNLLWLIFFLDKPMFTLLGASGGVMGVMIAAAMLQPNVEMLLLFIPFPIKLRTLAIVFICIDIFSEMTGGFGANVAYLAHIGGFTGGYLFMLLFERNYIQWDPLAFLGGGRRNGNDGGGQRSSPRMPRGWSFGGADDRKHPDEGAAGAPRPGSGPVTQRELDYLLDKISRDGINSLSEEEMERLREARRQMRGGRD